MGLGYARHGLADRAARDCEPEIRALVLVRYGSLLSALPGYHSGSQRARTHQTGAIRGFHSPFQLK